MAAIRAASRAKERGLNMAKNDTVGGTPYYVLMDGNCRIGPRIVQSHSGRECAPIYGFSDKAFYDEFCTNSQLALTPYPLVKVYLRDQASPQGAGLKLVVIDAAGPREPYLDAATIAAVLEAQESRTARVTTSYRLTFDREANAYTVEETAASAS